MIPGTNVTIGPRKYLVPPLNLRSMKLHREFLNKMMTGALDPSRFGMDELEKVSDLILLALQRNYPQLTVDQIDEHLDMAGIAEVLPALLKVSGFEPAEVGGETPSGE